jgi:hypothetical protein
MVAAHGRHDVGGHDAGMTRMTQMNSLTRMTSMETSQRNGRVTRSNNTVVTSAIVEPKVRDDDFSNICDADREIEKMSDITRDDNKNNIKKDPLSDIKEESFRATVDENT